MENEAFRDRVSAVVRSIPAGRTLSYGEVAARAGNPRAARAVGRLMAANFDETIPCHRVIRNDGSIGEYNRGKEEKRRKLREEGFV